MTDATLSTDQINTRLTQLYAMRDSGVLIVRHGDTSTQFRSMTDLLRAIEILESKLNAGLGVKRSRVSYIRQSSRGLGIPDYSGNGDDF